MERLETELRFGVTPRILTALSAARENSEPDPLLDGLGNSPTEITLEAIQRIHDRVSGAGEQKQWLHELMEGAQLCPARIIEPPKDPAVEAVRARRRAEFDEMQYQKMVQELGIRTPKTDADETVKNMTSGISVGISVLVSMATMFVVCYYMASHANYGHVTATICGLVGMVGIMVIETVLFMIQADRADKGAKKPRRE